MTDSTTFDADDWRSKSPDFTGETFRRTMAVVERLKTFARQRDISLPHGRRLDDRFQGVSGRRRRGSA